MKIKLVKTKDPKKVPKILRKESKKITEVTPELLNLIDEMKKIMEKNKGVGLAAVQVGVPVRLIILKNEGQDFVFINPEIKSFSRNQVVYSEGCLSFPDVFEEVKRPEKVKVKAKNLDLQELEIEASGIMARAFQHEVDHLNGVVFLDHVK